MAKINKSDKFLKLIGKHREQKKVEKFHGNLSDYLKIVEGDRGVTKLAHKRLFDTISAHGITLQRRRASDL
jgi:predicted Ser/Thr protein kinase